MKVGRSLKRVLPVSAAGIAAVSAVILLSVSGALVLAQNAVETLPEWQKAAGGKLSFEVASIKLADPGGKFTPANFPLDITDALSFSGVGSPHGHLVAQTGIDGYIEFAFKVSPAGEIRDAMLTHLPKWVTADQYVINAQASGDSTKDQMRVMMQSLLVYRLKLTFHSERREFPVFALVLGKPGKTGAKLNPHDDGIPCDFVKATSEAYVLPCGIVQLADRPNNSIVMSGRNLTIEQIAWYFTLFQRDFRHPVVNQTELDGRFDFTLQWTRQTNNPVTPDPGTTIQEAIQGQLGLKLKSTYAFIDTLVIDHIERPTEN
jgi:bla regulator protein blaR1